MSTCRPRCSCSCRCWPVVCVILLHPLSACWCATVWQCPQLHLAGAQALHPVHLSKLGCRHTRTHTPHTRAVQAPPGNPTQHDGSVVVCAAGHLAEHGCTQLLTFLQHAHMHNTCLSCPGLHTGVCTSELCRHKLPASAGSQPHSILTSLHGGCRAPASPSPPTVPPRHSLTHRLDWRCYPEPLLRLLVSQVWPTNPYLFAPAVGCAVSLEDAAQPQLPATAAAAVAGTTQRPRPSPACPADTSCCCSPSRCSLC